MQPLKLLTSGLLTIAILGFCLPTAAVPPDELILREIAAYRTWHRVTPEIIKQIPARATFDLSAAG